MSEYLRISPLFKLIPILLWVILLIWPQFRFRGIPIPATFFWPIPIPKSQKYQFRTLTVMSNMKFFFSKCVFDEITLSEKQFEEKVVKTPTF